MSFYNAFISYKQGELDNKVAVEVHKGLEHFRIPRAIRKITGKKKIERVFRDKDELPITNDLSKDIEEALTNSEYLIVICSPNTKDSYWVPVEIECFLKSHTKDHILAVLAGGKTKDVIPDILRYDERLITDKNGQKKVERIPQEPLACDLRKKKRSIRKAELTRLTAAIIGCPYDDLIQRQRQYKRRRMLAMLSAAFAGVVLFGIYMAYSNYKINKYYKEALNNQSLYLANESLRLLEDNQRAEALQLALASLPTDGPDRPVLPETIKALTQATLAYQHEGTYALTQAWDFNMPSKVADYVVSTDGKYLAALDTAGNFVVWETDSHKRIYEAKKSPMNNLYALDPNRLLIRDWDGFNCIDISTGKSIWTFLFAKSNHYAYKKGEILDINTEQGFLVAWEEATLQIIDIHDGSVIRNITMPEKIREYSIYRYCELVLSPSGKNVAAIAYVDSIAGYILFNYDTETGEIVLFGELDYDPLFITMAWGDDTHLLVATPDSEYQFGRVDEMQLYADDTFTISCYSVFSSDVEWETEMSKSGPIDKCGFLRLEDKNAILFYCANAAYAYDIQTGNVILGGHVSGEIIDVSETGESGYPILFTDLGEFCTMDPNKTKYLYSMPQDNLISIRSLPVEVDKVIQNSGYYYAHIRNDDKILLYQENGGDEDWKQIVEASVYSKVFVLEDGVLALVGVNDDQIMRIYDMKTSQFTGTTEAFSFIDPLFTRYKVVGVFEDTILIVYYSRDFRYVLMRVNKNGEVVESADIGAEHYGNISYFDGVVVFVESVDSDEKLSFYDIRTKSKESISLGENIFVSSIYYLPSSGIAIFNASLDYLNDESIKREYILDLDSKELRDISYISDTWEEVIFASENKSGSKIAVSDGHEIYVIDAKGNIISKIDLDGMTPLGISIENINGKDLLLVIDSKSCLRRYDPKTGDLLGKTDIVWYQNDEDVDFIVDEKNHQLFVHSYGAVLDIVDTDGWFLCGYVMDCVGYCEETDRFVTTSGKYHKTAIGYYKHYTLDDLVDKANRLLNGEEMSDEMKHYYGLS